MKIRYFGAYVTVGISTIMVSMNMLEVVFGGVLRLRPGLILWALWLALIGGLGVITHLLTELKGMGK